MITSTAYHQLAPAHEALLQKLKSRLLSATSIQRLYLLGLTISNQHNESLFSVGRNTQEEVTHCYLLALVATADRQSLNSIQDKIENNGQHLVPLTAVVIATTQFQAWLSKGHPFALGIYNSALLLHESGIPLTVPSTIEEAACQEANAKLHRETKRKVESFLAGADLYCLRKEYSLAAFMLHQAAEQSLSALLLIHTSLRVQTHNLDKLLRYCSLFGPELQDLFPKKRDEDKRLFSLLQRAYVDARYRGDYAIHYDELQALTEKVGRLQSILEKGLP